MVKLQGETLNFEISGKKDWDYDLKKVTLNNIVIYQLWIKANNKIDHQYEKLVQNPFINSITLKNELIDGFQVVEFTLKNSNVEAFDYLTDQPSKLVVDFYFNDEMNKKENIKLPVAKNDNNKKNINIKDTINRQPADISFLKTEEDHGILTFVDQDTDLRNGLFDGADERFQRFKIREADIKQSSIIKGLSNYYLKFPMLEQEFIFWKKLKANSPEYSITPIDTEENKQARLIKVLYDKKRYLVMQKTSKWFEEKFPKSTYLESIFYMNADGMLSFWKENLQEKYYEEAITNYNKVLTQFPNSVLSERTSLLLAMLTLDKKDYLSAIRKLNNHIENPQYKNKISQDYAKLAMSYAMLKINKLEDAIKLLDDVEKNSKNVLTKAEAAMRRGDFFFYNLKYDLAIQNYDLAIKKYSQLTPLYPTAYFNKMEALFRSKKPIESHKAGLKFVENFPAHEYAPYALTRVGELLEILGSDATKSTGAFLETQFRYGDSPRTVIAQLHLQSARMKSMKDLEVETTLKKMDELASRSNLEFVQQFKTTKIADGYNRREEYDKAILLLEDFYKKDPTNPDVNQITLRISKNINDKIKNFSEKENDREVLKQYKKYSDNWLKQIPRYDSQFYNIKSLVSVGNYESALKKINTLENKIKELGDDESSKYIKTTQEIPTYDQINLYKSICLFETQKFQDAYDAAKEIKKPESLSEKEQIKRVYYASLMYEKKGEYKTAIRYLNELISIWKDKPELLSDSLLKLSELMLKENKDELALNVLKNGLSEKTEKQKQKQILNKIIDLSLEKKQTDQAIKYLSLYINQFEKDFSVSAEKYKLGDLHFSLGEIKKAESVWATLTDTDAQVWSQLAQDKLKDIKWQEENKKYLKRIPAMSKESSNLDLNK